MKVFIDIPKSTYKDIKESYSITCGENFAQKLIKYIKNGVPLPKEATNGDIIKTIFPNYHIQIGSGQICLYYPVTEEYGGSWIKYDEEWWNAPYRGERGIRNGK